MPTSGNILDFQASKNHKLSFELLVDGRPIGEIAGSSAISILYWLFKTGVALFPLNCLDSDSGKRIVAVCPCGEYGCGCVRCDVVKSWDGNIVFRDFTTDPFCSESKFNTLMFCFSAVNYDSVVSRILHEIEEYENHLINRSRANASYPAKTLSR